jgi:ssDNA-binding Zn-finger/Zn-ribbon topoisomerase 1
VTKPKGVTATSTATATIQCPDCDSVMELKESRYGKFWGCTQFPNCRGSHGAHPHGSPLGVPANAETKAARIQAHAAFDVIWKGGHMKRNDAYIWLSRCLGIERRHCHISSFDKDMCGDVIRVCQSRHDSVSRHARTQHLDCRGSDQSMADIVSAETVDPYWGLDKSQ